jgi:hypothetical protein
MIIFVDDEGFVMNFNISGPMLKYTLRQADAQDFDTRTQAMHVVKVNEIPVDKVSLLQYNNT